jgi:carboxylesterase
MARKQLHRVRTPFLIIQSKRDQTVNPPCAEELYRLATAEAKIRHWLEQSDHVITLGPEKEEGFSLVTSFINTTVQDAAKIAQPGGVLPHAVDETFPDH